MLGMRGCIKGLFILYVLFLCYSHGLFGAPYKPANIQVGSYGVISSTSTKDIDGAITEKIVFYPHHGSHTGSKIERHGFLVRYPDAVGTILMCHGFMCDKFDLGFLRMMFPKGKYNIMTFDFRAHGEHKGGHYCTLGPDEAYDVIAAAQLLRHHPQLQGLPLYAYAFSMGAVAAIEAQAKDGSLFDAMILDCPFDSTAEVIKRGLEQLKFSLCGHKFDMPGREFLQKYAFHPYVQWVLRQVLKAVAHMDSRDIAMRVFPVDPINTVKKITVPVLYILCEKDEKVSVDGMRKMFNNTGSLYKKEWISKGRGHFDSVLYSPERYATIMEEFLAADKTQPHQEIIDDTHDSDEHGTVAGAA